MKERVHLETLAAQWVGITAKISRTYPPGFAAALRARVRRWEGVLDRWTIEKKGRSR